MGLKKLVIFFFCIQLVSFCFSSNLFAEYKGPYILIEGQCVITMDEDPVGCPIDIRVNKYGIICITNQIAKRVFVYKSDGTLINKIAPQNMNFKFTSIPWPAFIGFDSKNNIYTSNYDEKLQKYDNRGQLLWGKDVHVGDIIVRQDDSIIMWGYRVGQKGNEKCLLYNAAGEFMKSYSEIPLELGVVNEQSLGNGQYKVTVKYPDKGWEIVSKHGKCPKYQRDFCDNLYCLWERGIVRYDSEGKEIAMLAMPKDNIEEIPAKEPGVESHFNVIEEYGEPVLAPNGDVYNWKRIPDKYSIIKWVWVDGPECPQNLEVKPTANSLKFTWQKPLKDADKVSYYQLLQSFNICGPFR